MNRPSSECPRPGKRSAAWIPALAVIAGAGLACALPSASPIPTQEPCYWTQAYGAGSIDFEEAVSNDLGATGIVGTIETSSFGETYTCGASRTYSPCCLDVTLTVEVPSLEDQAALLDTADEIGPILKRHLPVSGIPNLGQVRLWFVGGDGGECQWDFEASRCE